MKRLITKHKLLWDDRSFLLSVIMSLIFFAISFFINYGAVLYSTARAGNATTDILLQNLPVVNLDLIFSEGVLFFIIFVTILLLAEPATIPFTLKSVALFICVRSIFVSMTHLAPYPDHIIPDLDHLKYITSGADLFFSGHTGLPFLLALLFWKNKYLKIIFLTSSILAAITVILGHLHYSIDVFSAFFITYGIYHIAQKAFKNDFNVFTRGLETSKLTENLP
ncbi:MAG: phosphatase PAP2-related protein [Patescibacteria group bacterium]